MGNALDERVARFRNAVSRNDEQTYRDVAASFADCSAEEFRALCVEFCALENLDASRSEEFWYLIHGKLQGFDDSRWAFWEAATEILPPAPLFSHCTLRELADTRWDRIPLRLTPLGLGAVFRGTDTVSTQLAALRDALRARDHELRFEGWSPGRLLVELLFRRDIQDLGSVLSSGSLVTHINKNELRSEYLALRKSHAGIGLARNSVLRLLFPDETSGFGVEREAGVETNDADSASANAIAFSAPTGKNSPAPPSRDDGYYGGMFFGWQSLCRTLGQPEIPFPRVLRLNTLNFAALEAIVERAPEPVTEELVERVLQGLRANITLHETLGEASRLKLPSPVEAGTASKGFRKTGNLSEENAWRQRVREEAISATEKRSARWFQTIREVEKRTNELAEELIALSDGILRESSEEEEQGSRRLWITSQIARMAPNTDILGEFDPNSNTVVLHDRMIAIFAAKLANELGSRNSPQQIATALSVVVECHELSHALVFSLISSAGVTSVQREPGDNSPKSVNATSPNAEFSSASRENQVAERTKTADWFEEEKPLSSPTDLRAFHEFWAQALTWRFLEYRAQYTMGALTDELARFVMKLLAKHQAIFYRGFDGFPEEDCSSLGKILRATADPSFFDDVPSLMKLREEALTGLTQTALQEVYKQISIGNARPPANSPSQSSPVDEYEAILDHLDVLLGEARKRPRRLLGYLREILRICPERCDRTLQCSRQDGVSAYDDLGSISSLYERNHPVLWQSQLEGLRARMRQEKLEHGRQSPSSESEGHNAPNE